MPLPDAPVTGHADQALLDRTAVLFNGMSQGVVFQDRSGAIVLANPAAERILGLTADELLGRTSTDPRWQAVQEDGSPFPGAEHPAMVALRTGQPVRDVVMGLHNPTAGEERWIRISAIPQFRAGEGEPFEVFTTFEDITRLKRLEAALRGRKQRFRIAAECSNDLLYEWNLDRGEIEYFGSNRSGLPEGERAPGDQWIARLHPDEREAFLAEFRQRLADGEPFVREHRALDEEGRWLHIVTRGRAVHDAHGRPIRWIGASSDITEQREAQQSLRQTLQLLEAVFDGSTDPIFVKDVNGRYLLINRAGAQRLGREPFEVIGLTDAQLMAPELAEALQRYETDVLSTGTPKTYESDGPGPDGPRRYLITKAPYRDDQGGIVGLIGIARDVTDLKRLEAEYRQAQKMEAVGRVAGGIAHDFNNLLTIILGCVEEVRTALAEAVPPAIEEIRSAAERAAQLTSQLLAFSRGQVLQPRPTDLNALIANLERLIVRVLGPRVLFRTALSPAAGAALVDQGQFEQVVMNLVVNARDAMPDGGRLTISTAEYTEPDGRRESRGLAPGRYVMVTVSDTGVGIDPEILPRLFEPFFTTKGRIGTGLGLSTVYGIVKQSGGDVRVDGAPGRGATFRILLPHAAAAPDPAPHPEPQAPAPGRGTVLIVDDEERLRALLGGLLTRQGYAVHVCPDVPDALAWIASYGGPLDLVLSDMVMPGGTGLDLARSLRRARPGLHVLFMSGYAQPGASGLGDLPPDMRFIQKPFTPGALLAAIDAILRD